MLLAVEEELLMFDDLAAVLLYLGLEPLVFTLDLPLREVAIRLSPIAFLL